MSDRWFVYIGELTSGKYYVGMTQHQPQICEERHKARCGGQYTRANPLERILWFEEHASSDAARRRERQLKGWSRAKKKALVDGNIERLKQLARSRSRDNLS